MKLLIVVTHLVGSGHLSRALTLGRAFAMAGHQVTVASGGLPVTQLNHDGIAFVQLPALRSDGLNFSRLLDTEGQLASQDYLNRRINLLTTIMDQLRPDVVITELFPFGRRSLKAEFTAMLQHAKALRTPLVLGSIRDILAPPSKPAKAIFAQDMITQFYDGVLVHADAAVTPLSLSWPVDEQLSPSLHYTGFVAPAAPDAHPEKTGAGEIIVSAGGGDVGAKLFKIAMQAATRDASRTWRILVGGVNAQKQVAQFSRQAPANALIEVARSDFRQMLNHAAMSVSMCGYNTALDVLQTGVPAVFVPFDAGGEVEQSLRAKALAKQPNIAVLKDADLEAETLLKSMEFVAGARCYSSKGHSFNGAKNSVEIVANMLNRSAENE